MDLVPPPYGGEHLTIEVPCLVQELSSVERSLPAVEASDIEAATTVQRGFYFGLLAAALSKPLQIDSFCTPAGSVCSAVVISHIEEIQICGSRRVGLANLLQTYAAELVRCEYDRHSGEAGIFPLVVLSVKVLLCRLISLCVDGTLQKHVFDRNTTWAYLPLAPFTEHKPDSALVLEGVMMSRGWCPHHIQTAFTTLDYGTAYFLSRLPRRIRPHAACSVSTCKAWSFDVSVPEPQHRSTGCVCEQITVSTQQVCNIIRHGEIPVVTISCGSRGDLNIAVTAQRDSVDYIAISHIWADGLGNLSANGLPACQLHYLFELLAPLFTSTRWPWRTHDIHQTTVRVWMDVFCIPPTGQDASDDFNWIKNAAIQNMNRVYAAAKATVVLDAELQAISTGASPETLLAQRLFSGWSTRAWTLQEGHLNPNVYFALSNGLYSPVRPDSSHGQVLYQRLEASKVSLWRRSPLTRENTLAQHFAVAWHELSRRASSQQEDLPAILANLLGLNTFRILESDTTLVGRLGMIIRSQPALPVSLLYSGALGSGRPIRRAYRDDPLSLLSGDPEWPVDGTQLSLVRTMPSSDSLVDVISNRWVPTSLQGGQIATTNAFESPSSSWTTSSSEALINDGKGSLSLTCSDGVGPLVAHIRPGSNEWRGSRIRMAQQECIPFRICPAIDEIDCKEIASSSAYGFILLLHRPAIDRTMAAESRVPGALLRITSPPPLRGTIDCVYEASIVLRYCPLEIDASVIDAVESPDITRIRIAYGKYDLQSRRWY